MNWSSEDLDYRAQLIPWTYWVCECGAELKATGRAPKCPVCGSDAVQPCTAPRAN